jgi:ankyrin repeat protein
MADGPQASGGLVAAARKARWDAVRALLAEGTPVDETDEEGWTALYAAADQGVDDMVCTTCCYSPYFARYPNSSLAQNRQRRPTCCHLHTLSVGEDAVELYRVVPSHLTRKRGGANPLSRSRCTPPRPSSGDLRPTPALPEEDTVAGASPGGRGSRPQP